MQTAAVKRAVVWPATCTFVSCLQCGLLLLCPSLAGPADETYCCTGNTGAQVHVTPGSPLVQYSETASVYQPRSRFAAEAAVPIQQERPGAVEGPMFAAGEEPVLPALPGQGAPLEAAGRPSAGKGASAPAIMTARSWPELVREVQQLPGPVGGALASHNLVTLTQLASHEAPACPFDPFTVRSWRGTGEASIL